MKKNSKKLLNGTIAAAIATALVPGAAGAATFADISDKNVAKAADRLAALGVVNGFEDGTYKPGDSVTREQFAKLLVEALGLGNAADAAKGATQFKDVTSGSWATGYINVAVGQGILKGYPDGTFKPTAQVKYSEAITMLVRALGYKDEFLKGTWPGNYIAKAAQEEITDGVSFNPNGFADRGSSAVLLNNTLDANIIAQTSYGDDNNYEELNRTLLKDKLKVDELENAIITSVARVDSTLEKDEVKYFVDANEDGVQNNTEKTVTAAVTGNVNVDGLLGLNATLLVNDDDEIFYTELDDNYTVFYDVIDKDGSDSDKDNGNAKLAVDEGDIQLINADDDFDLADDVRVFVNNNDSDVDTDNDGDYDASAVDALVQAADGDGLFAKVVVNNDGEVVLIDAVDFDTVGGVVNSVDTDKESIKYFTNSDTEKELKLTKEDAYEVFDANGNKISLSDIKANDVFYAVTAENKGADEDTIYVYVVSNKETVKGSLDAFADTDEVTIADKDYDLSFNATISLDANDSIEGVSTTNLDSALDEEVTAILDITGKVRHITTTADVSSDEKYGIVLKADETFDGKKVKLFTNEGQEVTYEVDLDSDSTNVFNDVKDTNTDSTVEFIEFTLDSDGKVDTIKKIADDITNVSTTVAEDGLDGSTLTLYDANATDKKGQEFYTSDSTVIFDIQEYLTTNDTDDIEIIKWDSVKDKDVVANTVKVAVEASGKNAAQALLFSAGLDNVTDETFYGYILDKSNTSNGVKVKVKVSGESDEKTYIVADADEDNVDKKDSYKFTLNSANELKLKDNGGTHEVSKYVYDIDGDYVQLANFTDSNSNGKVDNGELSAPIENATWFRVDGATLYYDGTDVKDFYDLDVNDKVTVLRDGRTIKVVEFE